MPVSRVRLTLIALVSLLATALLGLAVSRGFNAYRLEHHAVHLLGPPPRADSWGDVYRWIDVAEWLAIPMIAIVSIAGVAYGALHGVLVRVVVLAGFAVAAFLIGDHIAKPAVHSLLAGQLSFPSGNVTAVCATAVAMWLALYPVLGNATRVITFAFGAAWTLLMSAAVIGAYWHRPLDCIGSILLSVGVVTAGAAIMAPTPSQAPPAEPAPVEVVETV